LLRDRLHHQLIRLGTESLLIANRTFDRAVDLAYALGGTALPFDSYVPYLKIADVVIGSLTTDRPRTPRAFGGAVQSDLGIRLFDTNVPPAAQRRGEASLVGISQRYHAESREALPGPVSNTRT
jgi:glutamyl-tRNA reductase